MRISRLCRYDEASLRGARDAKSAEPVRDADQKKCGAGLVLQPDQPFRSPDGQASLSIYEDDAARLEPGASSPSATLGYEALRKLPRYHARLYQMGYR